MTYNNISTKQPVFDSQVHPKSQLLMFKQDGEDKVGYAVKSPFSGYIFFEEYGTFRTFAHITQWRYVK